VVFAPATSPQPVSSPTARQVGRCVDYPSPPPRRNTTDLPHNHLPASSASTHWTQLPPFREEAFEERHPLVI
jgi:hypothetical protein